MGACFLSRALATNLEFGLERDAPRDAFGRMNEAAWSTHSLRGLVNECTTILADHFKSPLVIVALEVDDDSIRSAHHDEAVLGDKWRRVVDDHLLGAHADGQPSGGIYRTGSSDEAVFAGAAPIAAGPEGVIGAVGIVTACREKDLAEIACADLRATAAHLGNLIEIQSFAIRSAAHVDELSGLFARAATCTTPREFAYLVTNSLRSKFECEQVAMGMVRSRRVELICVSGMDEPKSNSPGTRTITQAMEECLDRQRTILQQPESESSDDRYRLHSQWRQASGGAAVVSAPVIANGRCLAIVSIRQMPRARLGAHDLALIERLLGHVAQVLPLLQRAAMSTPERLRARCTAGAQWLMAPQAAGRKLLMLATLTLCAWFFFGSMTHVVTVQTIVSPAEMRHLVAPFEGRIATAPVLEGDEVAAGDILASMDTTELELERRRLEMELKVIDTEVAQAVGQQDLAAAAVAMSRRDLVKANLDLVAYRFEAAHIRAPFDAVVVRTNLDEQRGAVVPQGEALITLANRDRLSLEMLVPEGSIRHVRLEQEARFASNAEPERALDCVVLSISPSTEVRENRSVFVVESEIPHDPDVRIGMKGVSRIDAGKRAVWWIALHRGIDAVRLRMWSR